MLTSPVYVYNPLYHFTTDSPKSWIHRLSWFFWGGNTTTPKKSRSWPTGRIYQICTQSHGLVRWGHLKNWHHRTTSPYIHQISCFYHCHFWDLTRLFCTVLIGFFYNNVSFDHLYNLYFNLSWPCTYLAHILPQWYIRFLFSSWKWKHLTQKIKIIQEFQFYI